MRRLIINGHKLHAAALLLLAAVAGVPAVAAPTMEAHPGRFEPYVDVTLYPTFPFVKDADHVDGHYTLAFVTSDGACTAAWGGVIPITQGFITSDVAKLRKEGGDVIASFGGESGTDLAESCTDEASLQQQYQTTVDEYALTSIDFDVEGSALEDSTGINLRNEAVAALEIANPNLKVSYTLPVATSGLTQDGIGVLTNATQNGARVDIVNIMAMDFGPPESKMGAAVINSANSTLSQLGRVYAGQSPAQLRAMLGVTPMIGENDSSGEVFTPADAKQLLKFVTANEIGRVAMWSETRDRTCPKAVAVHPGVARGSGRSIFSAASATCSGIEQKPFAFSTIFSATDN